MKSINLLSALAIGFISSFSLAQSDHGCSRLKGHSHSDDRSARLSLEQIQLTENYNVSYYDLDVSMERTSTDIEGVVQIHAKTVVPEMDVFLFELWDDLIIDSILIDGTDLVTPVRSGSAVLIPVDFEAGDEFYIEIAYHGTPPVSSGPLGGGGMTNGSSSSWGNQVTWSLSEPFSAYEWFPCKQSLTDKADSVSVAITTDESNMAASNGLLLDVVELADDKKRFEWKSNYPIDYYLISVAVAEYVEYTVFAEPEGMTEPLMIQNFIYNNPDCLPYFEDDIDETVDYIELYSQLFGLYPFSQEKYGHAMAPIGGGMEHQTMTTQGFFTRTLTAHELAHQWFGNNVTCGSWSDIWLNEGFASYSEELMLAELYPGDEVTSMLDRHLAIMSSPGGAVWVEDSLNSGRIFNGRLTYDKGAAIIHTMRYLLADDDLFYDILQNYQEFYGGGTAILEDFKGVLEVMSGMDFTNYFNEWYYGEGFPTYSIDYNLEGDNLILAFSQTTSMPSVTPFFTNDLDIIVIGEDGYEELIRLENIDGESMTFAFPFPENVAEITIDPNNWIICRTGIVQENLELANLVSLEQKVAVYPNPTTDILNVTTLNTGNYEIIETSGRTVLKGDLLEGENSINVQKLNKGNYIIRINGTQKPFSKL